MTRLIDNSAGLIVNFYFNHTHSSNETALSFDPWIINFTQHWSEYLNLQILNNFIWQEIEGPRIRMCIFNVPQVIDTILIQFLFDAPGPVPTAWVKARKVVRAGLDALLVKFITQKNQHEAFTRNLTGYSIIYQAETEALFDELPEEVQQSARPLEDSSINRIEILARSSFLEGNIWLAAKPVGIELLACTVYIAIAMPRTNERFAIRWLQGPRAQLIGPDIVAHKAYYQHHQLEHNSGASLTRYEYERHLHKLFKTTESVMHQAGNGNLPDYEQLRKLAVNFSKLLKNVSSISRIDNSLQKQEYNMQVYMREYSSNNIWDFHLRFIDAYLQNSKLLVSKSNIALQAAQTALTLLEGQQERANSQRISNLQILLAILALLFGLLQVIRAELIITLYNMLGYSLNPQGEFNKFIAEIPIIFSLACVGYFLYKLVKSRIT